MLPTERAVDHKLRQTRLSRFGLILAAVTLCDVALTFGASIWLQQPGFNRSSVPLVRSRQLGSGSAGAGAPSAAVGAGDSHLRITRVVD